jgi:hypothetical protein
MVRRLLFIVLGILAFGLRPTPLTDKLSSTELATLADCCLRASSLDTALPPERSGGRMLNSPDARESW